MNSANDKYGTSLDRTLGAGKPVDPATRLSELLAQSLEELTRPFDPPRGGVHPARPIAPAEPATAGPPSSEVAAPAEVGQEEPPVEPPAAPAPADDRIDADKAFAELEAELFAAAKQVDRDASIPHTDAPTPHDAAEATATQPDQGEPEPVVAVAPDGDAAVPPEAHAADSMATLLPPAEPEADADAAGVIARVRRLMLISMAVTIVAVGSVFGVIGYRIFKGEGTTAKTADKLPPSSPIPTEMTLSLPRGARILQSAVANERLVITLEVDGRPEVRTFDVKTLQPTGRLGFSAAP